MSRENPWAAVARACLLCALAFSLAALAGAARAEELQIEAPHFSFDRARNFYTYTDGRISLGELSLFASETELDATTGLLKASGYVRIQTPAVSGIAERVELDTRTGVGRLFNASLFAAETHLYVEAEEVLIHPDGTLTLRSCSVTACPPGVPAPWHVSASTLELEPEELAVAWNPRLSLGTLPVLWLPVMAWPTVQERRTGMLMPDLERRSSSLKRLDQGWRVRLPVFLNLGFDHDLTLTPLLIQNRGVALEAQYRYAFWADQTGDLTVWGITERDARNPADENDILTPLGQTPPDEPLTRYRVDWGHNQGLGDTARLVLSYHDTSDGQMRREYDRVTEYRPYHTYQASLADQWRWGDAAATVEQNADFLEESVYATEESQTDLAQRPQLRPRFSGRLGGRLSNVVPLALELGVSAARFEATQATSGDLLALSPTVTLPIALGGAFELRPRVTRHFVSYRSLSEYNAGGPDTALDAEAFAQTEGTVELRTALARVYLREEGRYAALKHRIVPRLIFTEVQDVPQPLADQVLRARPAERLVTLRVDNELLTGGGKPPVRHPGQPAPEDEAAAAGPAPGTQADELLRVEVIQRYNLLLEPDAPALQGPPLARRQETEPGQPLLPLLVRFSTQGPRYALSALANYHHQLDRTTQTELAVSGQASARARLGIGYAYNEFEFATPENKIVPAGNALSFAGEIAFSDTVSGGFDARVNLQDVPPPLDRRIDSGQAFVEFHPVCYALRLTYSESVNYTLVGGQREYFLDRSVRLTFTLGGLVGGPGPTLLSGATPMDAQPMAYMPPRASCHG